ncbi:hypothetical protein POREN0001_0783 [Porphyromonas endodontalis ATCC 35406]|uniref:Uncharacterized protein n=1 Tax=Porphyromonas endodontalis (strain ATCC 35406 / DSM 24491 / JCM 8526 / CCUG 16442 / BCRC 14492 / NCTC 13058 / HG 370) TaxID=553175 RepID=C3J9N2_POREA|nr:hypothetical protein POREN0001_0783 [Porphyromonas endodontalis ATCC 35406]
MCRGIKTSASPRLFIGGQESNSSAAISARQIGDYTQR